MQLLYNVLVTQPVTDLIISIIVCAVVELIMSYFQTSMHDLDRDNFMHNRKQIWSNQVAKTGSISLQML